MKTNFIFLLTYCFLFTLFSCSDASPPIKQTEEKKPQKTIPPVKAPPFNIGENFYSCGWVKCGEHYGEKYIQMTTNWTDNAYSNGSCIRVNFSPCPDKEGGIYWMNREDGNICNWGEFPGDDFSSKGYTKVTLWIRGETGKEKLKIGTAGAHNSDKPHQDGCSKNEQIVTLSKSWEPKTLRLSGTPNSVINGFFWYASINDNPNGLTFYLDDIMLE